MCTQDKWTQGSHNLCRHRHTQTHVCGSHALGERPGCLRSAEGLGAGRSRTAAHLQDGNLPLQRAALFLQEGPGTWAVQHQKQNCRPGSQQSPAGGPHPRPPQEPPLGPPIAAHLCLCCPHAVPAQSCSPASLFLGRACPLSSPASQCPPEEQHSLFYITGLDLQVLLPPFSPASQPRPFFKKLSVCHLSPTSQDKSPQAKAHVGICT